MIGKAITQIITEDAAIQAIINGRLFPVSDYDQGAPAIYYIVQVTPDYVKNGPTMQDWRFTLLTMCKHYDESWQLASKLLQAFNKANRKTKASIKLNEIHCTNITDDYEFNINTFGQKLEFTVNTANIKIT
ncbi:hypothetical protein [Sunxiuqinia indica]|uniref:hypothetical protein n=1 Tax=Sunxiuqinia indica TaxID=2692584 RepID=UPI00135BAB09|nr:hypothetical protein [Sunxiuqinia indica]